LLGIIGLRLGIAGILSGLLGLTGKYAGRFDELCELSLPGVTKEKSLEIAWLPSLSVEMMRKKYVVAADKVSKIILWSVLSAFGSRTMP